MSIPVGESAAETVSAQAHVEIRPVRHPWVISPEREVRFGIGGGPFAAGWAALRDFVQLVEELGFDSYWRPDHPACGPHGWMTLAAAAGSTRRLRLGTTVTCIFYRH